LKEKGLSIACCASLDFSIAPVACMQHAADFWLTCGSKEWWAVGRFNGLLLD